jgi:glutamate racemase
VNRETEDSRQKTGGIGVFDSGVGGLSVLRNIRTELPSEDLLYVADSAHAPYGDRPDAFIQERASALVTFLLTRGVKAIVVACNTATAAAVSTLRERYTLPIVAMEPAVKPAAEQTRSGVVGVLATSRTLASSKFLRLVHTHGTGVQVVVQPCPGWVEQVERGDLTSEDTRALVEQYVRPLLARQADTLVLGCTHYPFLRPVIETLAGPHVRIVDPAIAVARHLRRRLEQAGLATTKEAPGGDTFWTTGEPARVAPVVRQLWGAPVAVRRIDEASRPLR